MTAAAKRKKKAKRNLISFRLWLLGCLFYHEAMKAVLIIMCGLPFSGKSMLAKELSRALQIAILSYDHDIYELHKHEVPPGTSKAQEYEMVESIARRQLRTLLKRGDSVIYDDLNLERQDRQILRELACECDAQPIIVYVDTPLNIIEKHREANRQRGERGDIDESTMQLDISLLQPPQSKDVVVVKPGDDVAEVVSKINGLLAYRDGQPIVVK